MKTSKLYITGPCEGKSLVTGEFSAQKASSLENVSIGWHHHAMAKPAANSASSRPLHNIDLSGQLYTSIGRWSEGQWLHHSCPGPWFNIKMTSYQYRKSHCGDKTISQPSHLHYGISYTGKTTSLYWIRAHPGCQHNGTNISTKWENIGLYIPCKNWTIFQVRSWGIERLWQLIT